MIQIAGPFNSGIAAGTDGAATANADTARLHGTILGVYVKYNDTPPAGTTDITLKTKGTSPEAPSMTVLGISNAATDGWFFPRVQICTTGGAAISAQYDEIPVDDVLNVAIAQANAGDSVDVWLMLEG